MDKRSDETGIQRKRLIQARELMGLDRVQLADLLGTDRTFIYRVEEGFRRPGLATMERWAKVLDVPLDVFRTPDKPETPSEAA